MSAMPIAPLPAPDDDELLARLAKALAHPARVRIVRTLIARRTCIGCDLVDEIGLAQSTVSEHLRILKEAGVITGEIRRPRICYALAPACLAPLARFLAGASACVATGGRTSGDPEHIA